MKDVLHRTLMCLPLYLFTAYAIAQNVTIHTPRCDSSGEGIYPSSCLIDWLGTQLQIDPSLISHDDNGFQFSMAQLPTKTLLFPNPETLKPLFSHSAKLVAELTAADLISNLPENISSETVLPLAHHVSNLINIYPTLITAGRFILNSPQWDSEIFDTPSRPAKSTFTCCGDNPEPKTAHFPLPEHDWLPTNHLPDLLSTELDEILSEMGFTGPTPLLLNVSSDHLTNRIAKTSLYRYRNMPDVSHGLNTTQLQIISAYQAGVLSKALLDQLFDSGAWITLFKQDLFSAKNMVNTGYTLYEVPLMLRVDDIYYAAMISPHAIHLNLLNRAFSKSIEEALASDNPKTVKTAIHFLETEAGEAILDNLAAIKALEDYTRYHHFQMLYSIFLDHPEYPLSFHEFISTQYSSYGHITFSENPYFRRKAMGKYIHEVVADPENRVFRVFHSDPLEVVEIQDLSDTDTSFTDDQNYGFVILQKNRQGHYNEALVRLLEEYRPGKAHIIYDKNTNNQ